MIGLTLKVAAVCGYLGNRTPSPKSRRLEGDISCMGAGAISTQLIAIAGLLWERGIRLRDACCFRFRGSASLVQSPYARISGPSPSARDYRVAVCVFLVAWLALSSPWLSGAVTIPYDAKALFQAQLQFI